MKGLRVHSECARSFEQIFAQVMDKLAQRYWLISSQAGPFGITDKANFEELEIELDRYSVRVPELENTDLSLQRPGIFPTYANLLIVDEWASLIGLTGPEEKAISDAQSFSGLSALSIISPEFFALVASKSATYLLHVDGWWEVYSDDEGLLDLLRVKQGVSAIDSAKWLQWEQ